MLLGEQGCLHFAKMGLFLSCCKESSDAILPHPDAETRRQQQAEAAERRMKENAAKGIKNPERVRQMEKKAEELERLERENAMKGAGGAPLRWQVN